ncbi:hypothetical protein H9P43_006871 [Blastocladiella emersonii ATCC 22665]|nr:hypothetical protein H9P43_006871 [Blastocladiella emersonii ATCC 22665]
MAIDFLAPAKVFEVEYSEIQDMLDHDARFEPLANTHVSASLQIKRQLAGANIDKTKVLDSLQCKDKSPSATRTTRPSAPGQRQSAAHKSKPDSLRRSVTVAIADAKCEITSLKEIKGASLRVAIKRARSVRSRSTATSKVGGRPRVGGIETELKHSFPRIKEWRRRRPRKSSGRERRMGAVAAASSGVS